MQIRRSFKGKNAADASVSEMVEWEEVDDRAKRPQSNLFPTVHWLGFQCAFTIS